MRTLNSHKVNPANDSLTILVADEPGAGGANHHYQISGFDSESNPSDPFVEAHGTSGKYATVLFQNGPIPQVGVNGVTHEALLAILIDRLDAFQNGPYACLESGMALNSLIDAQNHLLNRTRSRMARNVEGTHTI